MPPSRQAMATRDLARRVPLAARRAEAMVYSRWYCGTQTSALPIRHTGLQEFLQQGAALFWRQTEFVVDERSLLEGRFTVLIRRPAHLIA